MRRSLRRRADKTRSRTGNSLGDRRSRSPERGYTSAGGRVRRLAFEPLEDRQLLAVSILNGGGMGYVGNGGGGPPDITGAAGPNSYLEVSNSRITLFNKADGSVIDTNGTNDFFYNAAIGNQTKIYTQTVNIAASPTGATEAGTTVTITTTTPHSFAVGEKVTISGVGVAGYNGSFNITATTATTLTYTASSSSLANSGGGTVSNSSCGTCDSTGIFDNLMGTDGRFIIGDIDVETTGQNVGQYIFAVSTTSNPTAFDATNWRFYSVTTTEGAPGASSWSDYPGNPGFNADVFVETFNMIGAGPTGTQVITVNASDLAAGNPLVTSGAGQNVFSSDVPGGAQNYRPTAMQDAAPGDPMWLVHNPNTGNSLDVVKMTGVLLTTPTYATTSLALPAASNFIASGGINDPLNPNNIAAIDGDDGDEEEDEDDPQNPGGGGAFDPGARILNAGENNNVIVAAHTVAVSAGPNTLASAQANDKNGNPLGGTGYTVGDILTVNGGTFTTAATLQVATIGTGGQVATVTVANPGSYTSLTGVNGAVSGGTGAGARFSLFFTGELAAQWYAVDVSSGTPAFQKVGGVDNVGRISFGANTYTFEPSVNVNSNGDIGLGFMESDTLGGAANSATGGFISTFVTGRRPTDPAGVMQPIVLVPAGTGTANINSRVGDFSGMAIDPVNDTFWHANEFGGGGPIAIANFALFEFPPGISVSNGVMLICGDLATPNQNDTFRLERNAADPTMLDIFINAPARCPLFRSLSRA